MTLVSCSGFDVLPFIGLSVTVSARALNVDGASLAFFFHHDGTSPHRMGTSSRLRSRSTTASIVSVGQML